MNRFRHFYLTGEDNSTRPPKKLVFKFGKPAPSNLRNEIKIYNVLKDISKFKIVPFRNDAF